MASRNIPHCPVLWSTFMHVRGWAGKGLARGDLRREGSCWDRGPTWVTRHSLFYLLCAPHRVETLFHRRDLTSPWMMVRGESDAAIAHSDQFTGKVGVFRKENVFQCH